MEKKCGIYLITVRRPDNLPLYYVGQSSHLLLRERSHLNKLNHGKHANRYLQNAFIKYGEVAFSFCVLIECQPEESDEIEQFFIDEMIGHARCMNIAVDATHPTRGRKLSPEHCAKISAIWKGRRQTEDHRSKRAASISGENHYLYGKKMNDSHRDAISAGGKGLKRTDVTKARISSANIGDKNSMFGKAGKLNKRSRPVVAFSLHTNDRLYFESSCLTKASGFQQAEVSRCCNGKMISHKGFLWRFADQVDESEVEKIPSTSD